MSSKRAKRSTGTLRDGMRGSSVRSSVRGEKMSRMGMPQNTADQAQRIIVRDKYGNDVTPQSLVHVKPSVLRKGETGGDGIGSAMMSSGQTTPTSETETSDNFDRLSFTGFSRSGLTSRGSDTPQDLGFDPPEDEDEEKKTTEVKEVAVKEVEEEEMLTEDDLEKEVDVTLVETETFWFLDISGSCVDINNDSAGAAAVTENNKAYVELKKVKLGSDLFVERAMQTFNNAMKNKEVQATPASTKEAEVSVSSWDIYDTFCPAEEEEKGIDDKPKTKDDPQHSVASSGRPSRVNSARGQLGEPKENEEGQDDHEWQLENLSKNGGLLHSLHIVERAVAQNHYHAKHLLYRNYHSALNTLDEELEGSAEITYEKDDDDLQDDEEDSELPQAEDQKDSSHSMDWLWNFEANNENTQLTTGRNVSSMAWNRNNQDMLATSYGQFDFVTQSTDGLILFWSLKNPNYPERVYSTPCGVTALNFSAVHPNLLAAGLYDGTVAIYDIRRAEDKPVLESGHASGKHSDPVWELQWVNKGSEIGEHLVSVSTDGRITQWSMRKGLEYVDLMKLKRVQSASKAKEGKSEAFISRRGSGLCFDFSPKDPNIYLAGTEDGNIHKCSCSYSEQYLENYFSHAGPIYRVRWSPFVHDAFLSCSADWSMKLWHHEEDQPRLTLQSGTDYVMDNVWSPSNSTVFGSVTADGRIEIWDLDVSILDPVVVRPTDHKMTSILFSNNSPVVVTGGDNGCVDVFKLNGFEPPTINEEDQIRRLEKAMSPNALPGANADGPA